MTDTYGFAPTEKMLTPATCAEMLGISERHLTNLRQTDPTFPAPRMLGTLPRWSPSVIRRWMDGDVACIRCSVDVETCSPAAAPIAVAKSKKKAKGTQRVY